MSYTSVITITRARILTSKPCCPADPRQDSSQAAAGSNTKCIHVPFMSLQWRDTVAPPFSHVTSLLRQLQLFSRRIYCSLREEEVDWLLRLHRPTSVESLTKFNHRQKNLPPLPNAWNFDAQVSTSVPVRSGRRVNITRFTPCGGEHLSLYVLDVTLVVGTTVAQTQRSLESKGFTSFSHLSFLWSLQKWRAAMSPCYWMDPL